MRSLHMFLLALAVSNIAAVQEAQGSIAAVQAVQEVQGVQEEIPWNYEENETGITLLSIGWDNTLPAVLKIPEIIDGKKVTAIGYGAFESRDELQKVSIPSTVTEIGEYAFSSCSNLREIEFPEGLTTFKEFVCSNCSSLTGINIPGTVTKIEYGAFSNCGFKELVIPANVEEIGYYAFLNWDGGPLDVQILSSYAPKVEPYAFSSQSTIHVLTNAWGYNTYEWGDYTIIHDLPNDTPVLADDWKALQDLKTKVTAKNGQVNWTFTDRKTPLEGVYIDGEGNVVYLDLSNKNITGKISLAELFGAFPYLQSANLSENHISDITVEESMANLRPDLTNQAILDVVEWNVSEIQKDIQGFHAQVPSLPFYYLDANYQETNYSISALSAQPSVFNQEKDYSMSFYLYDYGYFGAGSYYWSNKSVFRGNSGDLLYMTNTWSDDYNRGSYFPARLYFEQGDSNFDGNIDIYDLQNMAYYAIEDNAGGRFYGLINYTASNLYADDIINIQDIVCAVNLILSQTSSSSRRAQSKFNAQASNEGANTVSNYIYCEDGKIILHSEEEVAAVELMVKNVESLTSPLALSVAQQRNGDEIHLIAYSLGGQTIPAGETVLAECSGSDPVITHIALANAQAQRISVTQTQTTSVSTVTTSDDVTLYYDLSGRRIHPASRGIFIDNNGHKTIKK